MAAEGRKTTRKAPMEAILNAALNVMLYVGAFAVFAVYGVIFGAWIRDLWKGDL